MGDKLLKEIEKLKNLAAEAGAEARMIRTGDIITAQWVRFKCRFGCRGYGKHLTCPPYAPPVFETEKMISEYEAGILLKFDGIPGKKDLGPEDIPEDFHSFFKELILWVNDTVYTLEKTAFYDDFPKAFAFGAYPCIYCEHRHCVAEESSGSVDESIRRTCRHMEKVRPTMEGAGIDVFTTAKNAGWELHIMPCKNMEYGKIISGKISSIGLVLLE